MILTNKLIAIIIGAVTVTSAGILIACLNNNSEETNNEIKEEAIVSNYSGRSVREPIFNKNNYLKQYFTPKNNDTNLEEFEKKAIDAKYFWENIGREGRTERKPFIA